MSKFRNNDEKLPTITKRTMYSCVNWSNYPKNTANWEPSWKSSDKLYSIGHMESNGINYILAIIDGNGNDSSVYAFKESDILELAKEQNMIEENFKLPEKWSLPLENHYLEEVKNWLGSESLKYNLGDWSSVNYDKTANDKENVPKHYTEITFEQFKKYVLNKEESKVDLKNDEFIVDCTSYSQKERKKVYEFLCKERYYNKFTYLEDISYFSPVIVCNKIQGNSNWENLSGAKKSFPNHPVLTFTQFEKKYLNMNKKIVGYKLLKELPFVKLGTISYFNQKNECSFTTVSQNITDSFIFTKEELEEAPDWFQPVYELEEVTLTLSNGKSVVVGEKGIYLKDDNSQLSPLELKNLTKTISSSINNWVVELTDATYKIGCWENVKLSEIQLILKTYENFKK